MAEDKMNLELLSLKENKCFGCGPENRYGLRISVHRDLLNANRIVGEFHPSEYMTGFPGITHGGAIYTALDCMATWSGMALRKTKAIWMLRSSTMTYHRPAFQGKPISLSAVIEKKGAEWDAIEVHGEAHNPEGNLLADGLFKVIPVAPDKFMAMTGIDKLPEGLADWLDDSNSNLFNT